MKAEARACPRFVFSQSSHLAPKLAWAHRCLEVFLVLYTLSIFISMAGMEMASWGIVGFYLMYFFIAHRPFAKRSPGEVWIPWRVGSDWIFAYLIVAVCVSWAVNPGNWSDFWLQLGGIRWIATLYAVSWSLRWLQLKTWLIVAYLVSLIVAGVYGIVTFCTAYDYVRHRPVVYLSADGGPTRAVSFLGFPMTWGHTSAIALCFLVGFLILQGDPRKSKISKWFWIALLSAISLSALNLLLTFTRGAWIAAAAGLMSLGLLLGFRILLGFFAGGLACGTAVLIISDDVRERLLTAFSVELPSNLQRIQLWKANWLMVQEHPWFGVGLNRNETLSPEYFQKLGLVGAYAGHAHNTFLQLLAGTGVMGFLGFMFFFGYFLWLGARVFLRIPPEDKWHRGLALGAFAGQVALHFGGLTECNFKAMSVNHHYILLLSITLALASIYPDKGKVVGQ